MIIVIIDGWLAVLFTTTWASKVFKTSTALIAHQFKATKYFQTCKHSRKVVLSQRHVCIHSGDCVIDEKTPLNSTHFAIDNCISIIMVLR